MRLSRVIALLALGTAAGQAPPASDGRALRLLAACKAASGGPALDRPDAFHEHGTFVRDGVRGTYDEYGDLHRLRTLGIHAAGGRMDRGGFDGTIGWRGTPDGGVRRVTDPRQLEDLRTDAYVTVGGYFYPDRFPAVAHYRGRRQANGRPYEVVEVVPAGGSPVDLWLDAATHRLGRITAESSRDAYADILSYRRVDGTWIGFGSRQVEGGHTVELHLRSYVYEPLDPERFAVPPAGE